MHAGDRVRWARSTRWGLVAAVGVLMGLAAGAPLWAAWPMPVDLHGVCIGDGTHLRLAGRVLPFDCPPAYAFTRPIVWPPLLAAGALFGLAARHLAGRGAPLVVAAVGGLGLYGAAFAGAQLVEELPSPTAPFVGAGAGTEALVPSIFGGGAAFAAGVFTLLVGLALGARDSWRPALVVVAVTWLAYAALGAALWRPLQDWPPFGRPVAPMLRTVFLCNMVAGGLGAGTALALLGLPPRRKRPRE